MQYRYIQNTSVHFYFVAVLWIVMYKHEKHQRVFFLENLSNIYLLINQISCMSLKIQFVYMYTAISHLVWECK